MTMARIVPLLLALLFVPEAFAADQSCDVLLGTTQVDYGRLSRATLATDADGRLGLPTRSVALHVRCAEPGDMTVFFRGARADGEGFQFTERGRFSLNLRDGRLDGVPVEMGEVDRPGEVPRRVGAQLAWRPGHGLAPVNRGAVAAGREFSAQMVIDAQVDERALIVSDVTHWMATGTLETDRSASPRELTLQADVQPGRCQVNVLHHLSFGHLRASDLDIHGGSTRVPSTGPGKLQVLCDAPLPFAFRVMRDERAGTAMMPTEGATSFAEGQLFGLGKTAADERIGAYILHWSATAMSDQGELSAVRSTDGGRSWVVAASPILANHAHAERVGYATPAFAAIGPAAVKALDVALDATIFIAPRHLLSLGDEITADGLVTFEIIY